VDCVDPFAAEVTEHQWQPFVRVKYNNRRLHPPSHRLRQVQARHRSAVTRMGWLDTSPMKGELRIKAGNTFFGAELPLVRR
jgi:hypothetical protein